MAAEIQDAATTWRKLAVSAGGLGYIRPAPGTWGSTPPCLLALGLTLIAGSPTATVGVALLALALFGSVACVALGRWAERQFQGKDPGVVVIDEVAGMAMALAFVPLAPAAVLQGGSGEGGAAGSVDPRLFAFLVVMAAFLLFRVLDIVKVQPANVLQQFPAGWGILLDDLMAGLYVNVVLQIFLRVVMPMLTEGGA